MVVVLSWAVNCFLQCNRCRKKNTTKNTRFSFAPVVSSACNKSRDENDASVIRLSFAFVIICYADYFVLLFFFLVLPQMLIWLISAGFLQHSFSLIKSATVVGTYLILFWSVVGDIIGVPLSTNPSCPIDISGSIRCYIHRIVFGYNVYVPIVTLRCSHSSTTVYLENHFAPPNKKNY